MAVALMAERDCMATAREAVAAALLAAEGSVAEAEEGGCLRVTAVTAAGSAAAAVGLAAAGLAAVMAVDTAPYSRSCRHTRRCRS